MTTEQLQTHLDTYPSRRDFCRELLAEADIKPTPLAVLAMEQILSHQLRRGNIPKGWGVAYRILFKLQKSYRNENY